MEAAPNWSIGAEGDRTLRIVVSSSAAALGKDLPIPSQAHHGEEHGEGHAAEALPPHAQELIDLAERYGATIGPAAEVAPRAFTASLGRWISIGDLEIRFDFLVDRLAIVMMLVVTGVGTLIHIYSTGYMAGEPPGTFARFFTYLNLFLGAMLILVTGNNLLLLFIGWEGVGMCSYLLIGFEYRTSTRRPAGPRRSSSTGSATSGSCWGP